MELRQLRYFVTAVEMGSISKAAEACRVAQPSLSQQISALEHELGVQVLERSSRGVRPTPEGEKVLEHARKMLLEGETLQAELSGLGKEIRGSLRMGVIPTVAPYLIGELLLELKQNYPGLDLELVEDRTQVLIERLSKGDIECAVVSDIRVKDAKTWSVRVDELYHEPLVAALPAKHVLARRRAKPKPEEINAEELIYLKEGHCLLDQTLKVCRVKAPDQRIKCDQLETALAMVDAGAGIAIVPQRAAERYHFPNVVVRSFAEPQPTRMIGLMRRRSGGLSPLAEVIARCLTKLVQP
ncbi:hydrogen peroxide-inducible genes activator [Rubritalea halochordaticola]|uniref:Hydrogen peroxide-inducible genes activator n=1 Tax=Rubritalea halochordaticola TaxID=714537 RepID=A0ABP9V3T2_9BACT